MSAKIDLKKLGKNLDLSKKKYAKSVTQVFKKNITAGKESLRNQIRANFRNPSQKFLNSVRGDLWPKDKNSSATAGTLKMWPIANYFEDNRDVSPVKGNYIFIPTKQAIAEKFTKFRPKITKGNPERADLEKFFKKYPLWNKFDTDAAMQKQEAKDNERKQKALEKREDKLIAKQEKAWDAGLEPSIKKTKKIAQKKIYVRKKSKTRLTKEQRIAFDLAEKTRRKSIREYNKKLRARNIRAKKLERKRFVKDLKNKRKTLQKRKSLVSKKRRSFNKRVETSFYLKSNNGTWLLGRNKPITGDNKKKKPKFMIYFILSKGYKSRDRLDFAETALKARNDIHTELKNIKIQI